MMAFDSDIGMAKCWVKCLNVSYWNLDVNSYTNTNYNNCHA